MKNLFISKLITFTAAIWWGSLTTLGFFVVPMLFQHLPSKALAGNMAARLFDVQTWVSAGCGLVLLCLLFQNHIRSHKNDKNTENTSVAAEFIAYTAIKFIAFGVLMALLVAFVVSPQIVARQNLMFWHAAGSAMYLLQWLCAGVVLYKLAPQHSK